MDKIFREIFPDTFDRIVFLIDNNVDNCKDSLIYFFDQLVLLNGTGKDNKEGLLTAE
jgi:hypothetical protein